MPSNTHTHQSTVKAFRAYVWQMTKAGQITAKASLVLQALAGCMTKDGIFPSHDTLAAETGASRSTVIRSLRRARELGVIVWQQRMKLEGGLIVRTSNLYTLLHDASDEAKQKAAEMVAQAQRAAQQRKAEYLRRLAVFRGLDQSVKKEPETQTSFYRYDKRFDYPEPQQSKLTRAEMLAACV